MKQKFTLTQIQKFMPSARLVNVQRHGVVEPMFQVSLVENLRNITPHYTASDNVNRFPALDKLAPPVQLLFPELQPQAKNESSKISLYIEGSPNDITHPALLKELGIAKCFQEEPVQTIIVLVSTGIYQRTNDKRQLLLQRYDQASHILMQVFWLDGCDSVYASVNSGFGRRNQAIEFYRTAARHGRYGCDTWILQIQPESTLYQLIADITQFADQLIAETDIGIQAETVLHNYIKQMFMKSGVIATIEQLPGWYLRFDDQIWVGCIDNYNYRGVLKFDYSKVALENVCGMLGLYGTGQLDLRELYDLIEHDPA